MMELPLYQIDAFAGQIFKGNPAAVCLLEDWLNDELLQNIAAENNLSETAFIVGKSGQYEIRWFSPTVEIDLCGHATLAAAYVLLQFITPDENLVHFESPRSGPLTVWRNDDLFTMDFPAQPPVNCSPPPVLLHALKISPREILQSADYLVVYENEDAIKKLTPDFQLLKELDLRGVIVTAKGEGVDFVSRFFAPNAGVNEDPVTGSAHCSLVPYWKDILHKKKFHALQLSQRGGELICEDHGDRIHISGQAQCYLRGTIFI